MGWSEPYTSLALDPTYGIPSLLVDTLMSSKLTKEHIEVRLDTFVSTLGQVGILLAIKDDLNSTSNLCSFYEPEFTASVSSELQQLLRRILYSQRMCKSRSDTYDDGFIKFCFLVTLAVII